MNTLTRDNAKTERNGRKGLQDLKQLFGEHEPSPADVASDAIDKLPQRERVTPLSPTEFLASDTSEEPKEQLLGHLAKDMIANAVSNMTRLPSPKLKPDFRATLMHRRALMIQALKNADEPTALIHVTLALVASEGAWDALQMLRGVASQLLWQTSTYVMRDRRTPSDLENASTFQDGEDDHIDADTVPAPTENEAVEAFTEAHSWLSTIADLLPVDEDDRIRLGLESGLEFCQVKEGDAWVRVYDVDDAIEIQIAKNRERMRQRSSETVLKRTDAFLALAALASQKRAA